MMKCSFTGSLIQENIQHVPISANMHLVVDVVKRATMAVKGGVLHDC